MSKTKSTLSAVPAQPKPTSFTLADLQVKIRRETDEGPDIHVSGADLAQLISMMAFRRTRGVDTDTLQLDPIVRAGSLAYDLEGLADILETLGHGDNGHHLTSQGLFFLSDIVKDLAARGQAQENGNWLLKTGQVSLLSPTSAQKGGAA
jgi:hypothetical protein